MRTLPLVLLLAGCVAPSVDPEPDALTPPEECPDELLVESPLCDDVFCGDPMVEVGTGTLEYEALRDGSTLGIWRGPQGGYHVALGVQMAGLCPVVSVHATMSIPLGDQGEPRVIYDATRHVQAVRSEPEQSTLQSYPGILGYVPCELWPDDQEPDAPGCGAFQSRVGHLEDFPLTITIEVEELVGGGEPAGRKATGSATVDPTCCLLSFG